MADGSVSSSKLSLALLKGKPAAQSVPSFSFRFNAASDEITQMVPSDEGK